MSGTGAVAGEKGSSTTKTPADFLKSIRGRPVVVKLNSGVDYRGSSSPLFLFVNYLCPFVLLFNVYARHLIVFSEIVMVIPKMKSPPFAQIPV